MAYTSKKTFANVSAGQTAYLIIEAIPDKAIRVVALVMVTGATATSSTFNSSSTPITSVIANGANGGAVLPYNFDGWFQTSPGQSLTVTTTSGTSTGYTINYIEI